ncbi:MAG: F0F1 ATP synthase subunit epsilon [Bacteroidales bacterium]|nr:F0F1 ATP synthase subunit epsilon [Bacteroidales bacterium]
MQSKFNIRILSPSELIFEGEADAVFLPGTVSPFEMLPGHAPIISSLSAGEIVLHGATEQRFAIKGGVMKAEYPDVTICVENL